MLSPPTNVSVYLASGSTDLRKSINGLAAIVQEGFQLDPCSSSWFVFCNRQRDKLKVLHWEYNGFWVLSRILDNSHYPEIFVIPKFGLSLLKLKDSAPVNFGIIKSSLQPTQSKDQFFIILQTPFCSVASDDFVTFSKAFIIIEVSAYA